MRASTSRHAIALAVLLGAARPPDRLAAQAVLESFTSENLAATAVGFDVGAMGGTNIRGTDIFALRLDFGTIAPKIRVLLGASYFQANVSNAALERLEQRVKTVVIDPSGDDTIRFGSIEWSDVTGDLDLQYVMPQGSATTAYLGLGVSVHVRHATGTAIDGTIVQDAFDAITAGMNATLGAEFGSGKWRFALEGRGVLASGLSTLALSAGVRYHWAKPR